jgi:hypothetical protein
MVMIYYCEGIWIEFSKGKKSMGRNPEERRHKLLVIFSQ